MEKVAIITDSNSGITNEEAKEMGVFVLPMPFMIDDEEYYEGINLNVEQFFELLKSDRKISTSQPSVAHVTDLWKKVLEEYDSIVHIPMSSGLSSSCQTALMLADDYDGKVQVVNNQRISVTQKQSVKDALMFAREGKSAKEIKEILERDKFQSSIYIMVDTLTYLKRGGRLTPAVAAIGTLLRIKPVLQIQGEKLDSFAMARTVKQAKSVMINAIKSDIENRFAEFPREKRIIAIAHTDNLEEAKEFRKEIVEAFPDYTEDEIEINDLSLSVSCHIGPGALAVTCSIKE
ncbi:MAG: DegV family protein [Lachnospiraceae bacterium]|nr:DegV family protein [Lachnospiraceae bacterium]